MTTVVRRPRVLLLAMWCNPEERQARLIGWAMAMALRRHADVHIVTEHANRAALLRAGLIEGEDFTAIDVDRLHGWRDRIHGWLFGRNSERGWGLWQALGLPGYYRFEVMVRRRFGAALEAGAFDLVHRLTPVTPDLPSVIAPWLKRLGIPFVLGPLNGGLPWPAHFREVRRAEGEWMSYLRGLVRFVPRLEATYQASSAILLASRDMVARTATGHSDRVIYLPENGIDPDRFSVARTRMAALPLRGMYLGRLVPYKGPDMTLEAAAPLLRDGRMTLAIVGSGPMRAALEAQVAALGVGDAVTFLGDVDHRRVQDTLATADVLCSPSVREFGGAVVMEAMVMGAVPIVVNYGGPPEYAVPDCAFVLPLTDRAGIVTAMQTVLERVAADPAQLAPRSERGQARARELFTWDAKARMMLAVYRWVLDPTGPKPDFGMPLAMAPAA